MGKITVKVKAAGGIAKFMPDGATEHTAELQTPATVAELLDALGVPRKGPSVILVNKVPGDLDRKLGNGDTVHLLPMVVGG